MPQSSGCVCGNPMPCTSLPVHLTASLPSQVLRADPHLHRRPWLIQTGPLRRQPHAHHASPSPKPTASSWRQARQAPRPPRPHTSVFPLLWQERRVSSLEAHSVACGRSTQTSHGCATRRQGRQLSGPGVDRKLGKDQGQPAG